MLELCTPIARLMGRPSFLRHPLFRLLSGLFMMAVVLQYSGLLLLTQRYMHLVSNQNATGTTNQQGLLEGVIVRGGAGGDPGRGARELGNSDSGRPKRIVSRFLRQPKQELPSDYNDGELRRYPQSDVLAVPHLPNSKQNPNSPYLSQKRRIASIGIHRRGGSSVRHRKVPIKLTSQEQVLRSQELPIGQVVRNGDYPPLSPKADDEADGGGDSEVPPEVESVSPEVTPSETPRLDFPLAPTKASMMAPMWNLINRIRDGFLSSRISTTPKPLLSCPKQPSNPDGPVSVLFSSPDWETLEKAHPEVLPGGHWLPSNCTARDRVALVIPFRDRDAHLRIFLQHMHPFLQRQFLDYTVYVVEQTTGTDFNRAMLMNVGFAEAEKLRHHDCFVFHDVDLLPEVAQNMYSCPHLPRHMSAAVDSLGYRLPYHGIFGGVSALRTEHFRLVNGFSNCFFGWGGEDDDMYNRIKYHGLDITRYPLHIARYRMLTHKKEMPSNDRFTMLNSGKLRYDTDGITSLVYEVKALERRPLYTLIRVHLNKEEVIRKSIDLSRQPLEVAVDGGDNGNDGNANNNGVEKESLEQLPNEIAPHNEYSPYVRMPRARRGHHVGAFSSMGGGDRLDVKGRLDKLLHGNRGLAQEVNQEEQEEGDNMVGNLQRTSDPVRSPGQGLSTSLASSNRGRLKVSVRNQRAQRPDS